MSQSQGSQRRDDRDRYVPSDRDGRTEDGPGPLLDNQDNLRRSAVQKTAGPVLERWSWGTAATRVQSRLRTLLSAGLLIIAIQLFLNPGGLTGVLITLWFLLSIPVVVLTAAVLVTLRDPTRATDVWWDTGMVATVGLVAISGFARVGRRSAAGRVAWQLLFDEDGPEGEDIVEESVIDIDDVRRIRQYIRYIILGSAGLILADQLLRSGILGATVPGISGAVGWAGLALGMAVVGIVLGFFAKVYGR